jgi:hypothetical protein
MLVKGFLWSGFFCYPEDGAREMGDSKIVAYENLQIV